MDIKIASAAALAFCAQVWAGHGEIENPYAVCAHVSRSGETSYISATFETAKGAGITWFRTDFDWDGMERSKGGWDFSHIDSMMALAKESGVNILPILVYITDWATPAYKHLDEWGNYVGTVVRRYRKDIRYWEVYNEPNLAQFWKEETPKGADYARLLERSWSEIKKVDSDLKVLYAGVAGVPLEFIEDSFKAGAAKHFDIMNVHPYNWGGGGRPEKIMEEISALKKLMEKYGVADRPIWITEVGWPTMTKAVFKKTLTPALERVGIAPAKTALAVVSDPAAGYTGVEDFESVSGYRGFREVRTLKLSQLENLDTKKYPVLVPSFSEDFPESHMYHLIDYVARGGTIIFPTKGLPLFKETYIGADGKTESRDVGNKYLKEMHVGWETWWSKDGVPKEEKWQKAAADFVGKFDFRMENPSARFLTSEFLEDGDEFIPLIEAGADGYRSAVAGIYKLHSSLKGNVIVYTNGEESIGEDVQARNLPVTFIVSLASGADRVFWYNFRAGEWDESDPEAHFGVVHKDLKPKPAFEAWKLLSKMYPGKSTRPEIEESGGAYLAEWTKPGGAKVWALWAPNETKAALKVKGGMIKVTDYMGNGLAAKIPAIASPKLVYIEGPESVSFK